LIALIDYGSGNIRSVHNALLHLGAPVERVSGAEALAKAAAVVLPGVGAFGDCVKGIRERGLWEPLVEWLAAGKPFLGICVGYQMLFEESEESPGARGFGFFGGRVRRFTTPGLKVPQIGWNRLECKDHWLWDGLPEQAHVYFVHSYYPQIAQPQETIATADYGVRFAAAAARGNVVGVQFHPEKSQAAGLRILRNFLNKAVAC